MRADSLVTAALPRSILHLSFLAENQPETQLVLFRDSHMAEAVERMFPGRGIDLGREQRPTGNPLRLLRTRAANRAYYESVGREFDALGIDQLILFLEGEPLERFLLSRFRGEVELWEEGISHYLDLTSPLWYAARGLVQHASGFYPKHITRRRADRSAMRVRDRFEHRNLTLPTPELGPREQAALLIGSPLVEDGIISATTYRRAVTAIAAASSPLPSFYLPHPREKLDRVSDAIADIPGIAMLNTRAGLTAHLRERSYALYIAATSTALLDLKEFDRSLFTPGMFGLGRIDRELRGWKANPVAVGGPTEVARLARTFAAAE